MGRVGCWQPLGGEVGVHEAVPCTASLIRKDCSSPGGSGVTWQNPARSQGWPVKPWRSVVLGVRWTSPGPGHRHFLPVSGSQSFHLQGGSDTTAWGWEALWRLDEPWALGKWG